MLRKNPRRKLWALIGYLGLVALLAGASARSVSAEPKRLFLPKLLAGKEACALATRSSVSFLTNDKIMLLSGQNQSCYRSLSDLELVVLSLDGTVLASKPWHQTLPLTALSNGRIVTLEPRKIVILGADLQPRQTLELPTGEEWRGGYAFVQNPNTLVVRSIRGSAIEFRGDPLARVQDRDAARQDGNTVVMTDSDGSQIVYSRKHLLRILPSGSITDIASLSWVNPCEGITCQEYEAGMNYQISAEPKPRIVFTTNGSRFPVTDAAGVFPYFRVEVFGVPSGAEVFRKEFIFKTAGRSASISPNGELLLFSDGREISFQSLP